MPGPKATAPSGWLNCHGKTFETENISVLIMNICLLV
ncbi:phage tail protein [Pectobacterium aroidearum]|nr:tail fiber protein [Pectobacterium aroidearum]UUE47227.1 phage tail protein [Pectobacterium aroidearum]UUE51430.1 phage tail protein [Pectobacterium aroidearum]UUE55651.1 phage tail protein [Pectobacterium aroidearum]UUE64061.1 phage tail protein [Pectobacterium aroidearum]UUE68284.1 phage tail protein [Pectobacterium aroidearum]